MQATRREVLKLAALYLIPGLRPHVDWAAAAEPTLAAISGSDFVSLRRAFKGELITAHDPGYDAARAVASFNPTTERHPQIIACCADQQDIIQAVQFARAHSLEAAVRSGGFDVLGACVCDGMVVDLSRLKLVAVDDQNATARVQAGVRSAELGSAAEAHGLAAALGCHPAIGISGLTLGGGLGWLAGNFGASCDNLIRAEIITAEGRVLRASAAENPDLFWAIKGGGGNFGIISELELRLHPLGPVFGGVVAYRGDFAAFLRFYRDFMEDAPDELTMELNIRELGKPTLLATACWSGDPAEGERVLRPLRKYGPPTADAMRVVSLNHLIDRPGPDFGRRLFGPEVAPPAPPQGARRYDYWRGGSLQRLSDEAAAQIASVILTAPPGWSIGLGHYLHGRASRVTREESPLPRKPGQFTYFLDANWWNPGLTDAAIGWVNQSHAAMRRYSSDGTYIDYLSSSTVADVRASYGENYDRLSALKRKYDPENFFHLNRNIRPS